MVGLSLGERWIFFVLRFGFLIGVGVECVIRLEIREQIHFTRLEALSTRIIPRGTDVDVRLRV